jgi:hypothetical protein
MPLAGRDSDTLVVVRADAIVKAEKEAGEIIHDHFLVQERGRDEVHRLCECQRNVPRQRDQTYPAASHQRDQIWLSQVAPGLAILPGGTRRILYVLDDFTHDVVWKGKGRHDVLSVELIRW